MKKIPTIPIALFTVLFINLFLHNILYAGTLEVKVTDSHDDAEENISNGAINLNSNGLDLAEKTIGIRFNAVTLPKNAIITKAYLKFYVADTSDKQKTNLTIHGQAHDQAPAFTLSNKNISLREKTTHFKSWSSRKWKTWQEKKSEDIKDIVQEIINREGWRTGHPITFIITGTKKRVAHSRDYNANKAPLLHIEYDILAGSVVDPTNDKKVLICHIPPGNPDNVQNISISKKALKTHQDHHGDYDGICKAPPPSEDSTCTALFEDDFESGLSDKWRTLKASGGFTPQVVNGRLRLTNREHNLSTAVTLDYVFPSKDNKFTIEFDYYAYGGCANNSNHRGSNNAGDWGADGISIALFDSSVGASPRVGGNGGSLGYANKTNQLGFEKGWLGVGIDEYGNFENNDEGRRDLNGQTYDYISEKPNTIAIRGNETSGYRLLASTTVLGEALAQLTNESYKSGRYRFAADMFSNGFQEITLERNTGSGYTTLIGPFNGLNSAYHQGNAPEKFRIALSSGTGGACNIHEIDNLKICSEGEEYNPNTITSCETGFFQHLQKGSDKHELGKLDIEAQTYEKKFSFDHAELNALGYSVADEVFYGTSTKSGDHALYKVNLDGTLERLIDLPTAIYAGDVDNNNVWYGFKGKKVYKVDFNNTPLTLTQTTTANNLQAVDFVFKVSDGKFYGVKGASNPMIHTLYMYNPADNSVTSKPLTGDIESNISGNGRTYGAAWTDASGAIYVGNNLTGKIHWVDPDTGKTIHVATGTSGLSKNDGISCAAAPAPFEFDYGDAPESYGISPHLIPVGEPTLYLGTTAPDAEVFAADYPYTTGEATGDDDSQTNDEDGVVDFQHKTLIARQTYSVDVNTYGAGGYLNAWIDWNGNGIFEDDNVEHIAASNIVTNESGKITLNITVPRSAVSGTTYARFRYSTIEDLSPTQLANDGEVEDYKIIVEEGVDICSIDDVDASIYSTAAVAVNLKRLDKSTRIFQTQFNNATWEGYLLSYDLDITNNNGNTKSQQWNAANKVAAFNLRKLLSYNPQALDSKGIDFLWGSLNATQKTALKKEVADTDERVQQRLNWLRGDQSNEDNINGPFRERNNLLGDFIHSSPIFSGQRENFGYTSLKGTEGSSYPDFLTQKLSRQAALYLGSNDGMLHGFNANNGEELFGFIPNEVIPNLVKLPSLQYGCQDAENCIPHQYYVDGPSTVGDAYFKRDNSSDALWHTVLIGTLGKGGKGIFALDVTTPENITANHVLWELSATQASHSASIYTNHMGYSTPKPSIARLNDGSWAAIISNGYESSSGTAMLFLININNGQLIKAIDTGVGSTDSPNGLSSPIVVDINNDRKADAVYAGDLQGNMWKFNLSGDDITQWDVAYKDGDNAKPLFTTCERADEVPCTKPQAITAKPEVGHHPAGGYMVYFGTGQYFDVSDNVMSASPDIHTLYGIRDNDAPITDLTGLVEQTILHESIIPDSDNDLKARITSSNPVDFTTKQGWYMRLIAPNNTREGERIVAKALLREERLIITTLIPPQNSCTWGGASWITEINALDGNPLDFPPIDINDDQQFTSADKVLYQNHPTVISAIQKISLGMILSTPEIINHTSLSEGKYMNGTIGTIGMFRESTSRTIGRQSWRRLR